MAVYNLPMAPVWRRESSQHISPVFLLNKNEKDYMIMHSTSENNSYCLMFVLQMCNTLCSAIVAIVLEFEGMHTFAHFTILWSLHDLYVFNTIDRWQSFGTVTPRWVEMEKSRWVKSLMTWKCQWRKKDFSYWKCSVLICPPFCNTLEC